MNFKEINKELFVAETPIVMIGDNEIKFIKQRAQLNERKRARICAHRNNDDPLHEMIIAISDSSYIRPHRHNGKSESFHIIEGVVDVVMFDDSGAVIDVVKLGKAGSGRNSFYRLSESMYHTVLVRSDMLVMHEVTNGPFSPEQTEMAPFAPDENDTQAVKKYSKRISDEVMGYLE